jgi:hypothetical protein
MLFICWQVCICSEIDGYSVDSITFVSSIYLGVCEVILSNFGTTGSCVYTECAEIVSQEVCVANHCNSAQLSDGTILCSDPGSG